MMKKSVLFTVMLMLVLAIGAVAVDATVSSTTTYGINTPTFGDADQLASNPKSDKSTDKNILVTRSLTLQSTLGGGEQITGITVVPEAGFSLTDLNISLKDATPITVANAGTAINFDARIPEQLDAVNTNFKEQAFKVARVDLLNGATVVGSFDVYMQRKNQLVIDDIDVVIQTASGSENTKSLDPDDVDKLKDIKPGDELEITVKVENRYKSSANINIENIDVDMELTGEDFDDQNDDELGDLSEDDNDEVTLTLVVDEDADRQTADLIITVNGEDENGALHGDVAEADVEIERETHEILVQSLSFVPSLVSCSDDAAQLTVKVKNIGRRDEKEVAISVESNALNYKDRVSNLELDKDDTRTKVFNIPVNKNLEEGKYAVQVQTFTDNTDLSNTEVILLESTCNQKAVIESSENTLVLQQNQITLGAGKSASVPVLVKNIGNELTNFIVSVNNADDFLESVSPKTATLNPGQQTTLFFNLRTRKDLEAGTYNANIVAMANGETVDSETFTVLVNAEKTEESEESGSSFGNSQVLWIILDVFLVIIAIFFIKMIFSGRRKGVKMRDIKLQ